MSCSGLAIRRVPRISVVLCDTIAEGLRVIRLTEMYQLVERAERAEVMECLLDRWADRLIPVVIRVSPTGDFDSHSLTNIVFACLAVHHHEPTAFSTVSISSSVRPYSS